VVTEEEGP